MSDLDEFSRDIAAHVRAYLTGVHEIAAGESPETAVAGLIAYVFTGLIGFIVAFIAGVITGSRATLLVRRAREQPP